MKKILNSIRKIFIINLIVLVVTASTTVSFSNEETQEVTFSFKPTPKIDVVLAKQKTSTNVTNFEKDLLKAIETQGINTDLVKISSVQAQTVDIAKSFSWNKDVSGSIGSISISSDGKNVVMYGNPSNPGKNAIWIIPGENQEQEFNFSYNIDYGDSFNAAGMLLRVQRNGNTLRGYMLSFNNKWYSAAGSQYGAIWEFTYVIGQNYANMSKVLKRGINISRSGTLNVKVDDNQITITGGGMSYPVTYVLENTFGNGYGFFSDHYSHGCSNIGSFALTGINLKATTVRKFSEILREPSWREKAIKVLVNVSDVANDELNTDSGIGELSTRLINENINYVAWGKDANKTQYNNLITANNGNGIFINNTAYSNSITKTAEYIKTLVDKLDKRTDYLLIDEPLTISAQPSDILKNTEDEKYPNGKWKIVHDYTYYENNMGQFAQSNRYISDMVDGFDKTGKYTITYEDKSISPKEIYVHRRPVASIEMKRDGKSVTFSSNSYDLDLYSREDKGISEEEWKYKKTTDTNWTNGKLTTLENETAYLIQLRVKDFQDTWSNATSLYVTTKAGDTTVPIAAFEIKNEEITKYETLEITDTSYDPSGKEIKSETWEVYKDGNKIYGGATPLTKYNDIGTYVMKLTVINSSNAVSETYSRPFKIVDDTTPPEVIAIPEQSNWTKGVTVNLKFSDVGGSNFKDYKYAITDSLDTPSSWSTSIAKQEDNIKIEQEGKKYLHVIATDNAGNVSQERIFGEFFIDRTAPSVDVDKKNHDWAQTITVNLKATDEQSGIKHYKYAITDDNEIPKEWSDPILKQEYSIEITQEGRKYLHIIAEDNVENISEDIIYAEYLVDNSKPEITIEVDTENIKIDELIAKVTAIDKYSGVKILTVQGEKVQNELVKFIKNGTYEVYAEDNVGQTETKILKISNIYYECTSGLNHPIYSSDYDRCPICKLLHIGDDNGAGGETGGDQGNKSCIKITNETSIYDGKSHKVEYEKPEDIEIVEYYNGSLEKPKLAGDYNYELKIIYNEKEYETGVKGVYKILPREITCEEIKAADKQYDKTNVVEITGGKLVNTVDGDDIQAVIQKTGITESEKVGNWKVKLGEITLMGNDAANYQITQPKYGTTTVNILPREITCDEVKGKTKKYDRNNIVEIVGGKLVNTIDGDDIQLVIPKTGIAESEKIGNWKVELEEITLVGKDALNYNLTQPQEIRVEIVKPDEPLMKVNASIAKINEEELQEETDTQTVIYNDYAKIKVSVQNNGDGSGYISKIKTKLPNGVELIKNSKINEQYKWKINEQNELETSIYSIECNIKNELDGITAKDEKQKEKIETKETKEDKETITNEKIVELEVKINNYEKKDKEIPINFEIEQQDKNGDTIEYTQKNKENSTDSVKLDLKYFDASIQGNVKKFILTNGNEMQEINLEEQNGKIAKIDIPSSKIEKTNIKILYEIALTNEGTTTGNIQQVIDTLPKGVTFNEQDNPNWKVQSIRKSKL